MRPVVIYDMDDTITRLSEYVLNKTDVKPEQFIRYNLEENEAISLEKKQLIQAIWESADTFREVIFEDDIERLVEISKLSDIDFKIHSMSLTEEIMEVKRQRLTELGFDINKIYLDLGRNKDMKACDIIVEDSIHNLSNSLAKFKVLMNRNHNQIKNYPEYRDLNFIRTPSLVQANDVVINILRNTYKIAI